MLVFNYGVMGSSKSAQALMIRFNYLQKGFNVIFLKPSVDTRGDNDRRTVSSRIGLEAECLVYGTNTSIIDLYNREKGILKQNIVIVDEAQFSTKKQINQLKYLAKSCPVICFGLKTNFKSELFEGSKRLIEIADEIKEIPFICKCGKNAIINARIVNGKVTTKGAEVLIGGDDCYEAMCYDCWKSRLKKKETNLN